MTAEAGVLELEHVTKVFGHGASRVEAVQGVSLAVPANRSVGIIGESGSGKSTLARMIVGLEAPTSGRVILDGTPVGKQRSHAQRRTVQIVYQDPRASLNPRLSILASVADFATVHRDGFADSPAERAKEALDRLGLGGKLVTRRPAELSGGQLQRACIARALVVRPSLLVADEPTSALDASVQGQVLNALDALRDELAIVLISHDIDVVRFLSDDVAVMLSGAIVETGPAAVVMAEPRHEYARRLITLRAPRLDTRTEPI